MYMRFAQVRERAAALGQPVRATQTEVLVASIGNDMQVRRPALGACPLVHDL